LIRNYCMRLDTSEVFVLGKKNAVFIQKLSKDAKLFGILKTMNIRNTSSDISQKKNKRILTNI
jgi:hypothetical protein